MLSFGAEEWLPFITSRWQGLNIILRWARRAFVQPDEPFHNLRASRSGDRLILCSSGTSCDWFWSSKIVKGFVGIVLFLPRRQTIIILIWIKILSFSIPPYIRACLWLNPTKRLEFEKKQNKKLQSSGVTIFFCTKANMFWPKTIVASRSVKK